MENKCAACKNAEAEVTARVADRETGAMSNPVPLCRDCFARISKTRKTEIVKEMIPETKAADKKQNAAETETAGEEEENVPLYLKNIEKIDSIFDAFKGIMVAVSVLFCIFTVISFANESEFALASLGILVSAVFMAIFFHVLHLAAEAIKNYLETHKQ